MAQPRELTDAEVFGAPMVQPQAGEMSDADVFGGIPAYPIVPVQQRDLPQIPGSRLSPVYYPQSDGRDVGEALEAAAEGVPVVGPLVPKALALGDATVRPLFDPNASGDFGQRYQDARAVDQALRYDFNQRYPHATSDLQLLGGVAGGLTAAKFLAPVSGVVGEASGGLIPRMAAGGFDAGAAGALHGYFSGDAAWNDPSRVDQAKRSAVPAALFGIAAPAVVGAAGSVWNATGRHVVDALRGPQTINGVEIAPSDWSSALARIARATDREGLTPAQALDRVQTLGPNGTLADVGESTRDLANAAVNTPSRAPQLLADALNTRQRGVLENGQFTTPPASARVAASAADGLGVGGSDYNAAIADQVAARKAAAGPAYAKAYAAPPIPVTGGSVRGSVADAYAAATGAASPAPLADFEVSPLFQQAYARARQISETEFVAQPDGSEKIIPLPAEMPSQLDWRTLDLMKQAGDDLLKEGKVQGIGANAQGALKGYQSRFVAALDKLNPDYGAAREAFAGPSKLMDAAEAGRGFLREDGPSIAEAMAGMSPSEQAMFRVGAVQGLKDRLGNADVTNDASRVAGYLKPNQLERFRALFPDQASYAAFANRLGAENTMAATRNAVLGGSQTARRFANTEDAAEEPSFEIIGHGMAAAGGDHGSLGHLAGLLLKQDPNRMRPGVANGLAAALTMGAADAQALRGPLEGFRRRTALVDAIRNSPVAVGGSLGAQLGLRAAQ